MRLNNCRNNFTILLFCMVINACNNDVVNQHSIPVINIEPNLKEISCSISELVHDMKIVHLETKDNCLIDAMSSLISVDEKYIIYKSGKTIIVFDNQGKFLNKIDALGKGSKEYKTISNSFYDPIEEYIYIVDYNDVKIYSIDGEFIKQLVLPLASSGIFKKHNGEMVVVHKQLYNQKNRDMISITDTLCNIYHTFKSKNPDVCEAVKQNLFFATTPYETHNRLFYYEPFVDTIYEIKDTMLIPHWHINLGNIGSKTKDGINISNYHKALDKLSPIGLHETENYFFLKYTYKKAKFLSLFDKKHNSFIFHQKYTQEDFPNGTQPVFGIDNDLINMAPLFWPEYYNDSIIVSVTDPMSLSDSQLNEFKSRREDNPILFIGTLK